MTALPHQHGLRPGKPAHAPLRSKSDGKRPHPGARASRPHALPFGAAQFPCDSAPGHSAGGKAMGSDKSESWRRCRSSRVEEMNEAAGRLVRAGRPRSRVGFVHLRRRSEGAPSVFVSIRVHSCPFVVPLQQPSAVSSSNDLPGKPGCSRSPGQGRVGGAHKGRPYHST